MRAAERIGEYPKIGVVRPDFTSSRNHRFVVLTGFQYWIVYAADRDAPMIVKIVHTSRDLPRLLRNLR